MVDGTNNDAKCCSTPIWLTRSNNCNISLSLFVCWTSKLVALLECQMQVSVEWTCSVIWTDVHSEPATVSLARTLVCAIHDEWISVKVQCLCVCFVKPGH